MIQLISKSKHNQWRKWIKNTCNIIEDRGIQNLKQQWKLYDKDFELLDQKSKSMYNKYSMKNTYLKAIKPKLKLIFQIMNQQNIKNNYVYISFISKLFKDKSVILQMSYQQKYFLLIQFNHGKFLQQIPQNYLYLFDFLNVQSVISIDQNQFKSAQQILKNISTAQLYGIGKNFGVEQQDDISLEDYHK